MIAIRSDFIFLGPDGLDTVIAHQTGDAPLPNVHTQFLLFIGNAWVVHNFLGLSDAVHGYVLESPYRRVDAGSWGEPAKRQSHTM